MGWLMHNCWSGVSQQLTFVLACTVVRLFVCDLNRQQLTLRSLTLLCVQAHLPLQNWNFCLNGDSRSSHRPLPPQRNLINILSYLNCMACLEKLLFCHQFFRQTTSRMHVFSLYGHGKLDLTFCMAIPK